MWRQRLYSRCQPCRRNNQVSCLRYWWASQPYHWFSQGTSTSHIDYRWLWFSILLLHQRLDDRSSPNDVWRQSQWGTDFGRRCSSWPRCRGCPAGEECHLQGLHGTHRALCTWHWCCLPLPTTILQRFSSADASCRHQPWWDSRKNLAHCGRAIGTGHQISVRSCRGWFLLSPRIACVAPHHWLRHTSSKRQHMLGGKLAAQTHTLSSTLCDANHRHSLLAQPLCRLRSSPLPLLSSVYKHQQKWNNQCQDEMWCGSRPHLPYLG